jgi:diguanylate cyclase (GGDEF)-like protein
MQHSMQSDMLAFLHTHRSAILDDAVGCMPAERRDIWVQTWDTLLSDLEIQNDTVLAEWAEQCVPPAATAGPKPDEMLEGLEHLHERIVQQAAAHLLESSERNTCTTRIAYAVRRLKISYLRAYHHATHEQIQTLANINQEREHALRHMGQVENELRTHIFELEVLYELTKQIGYTLNYLDLMHLIQENLHRALHYDVAVGLVLTEEQRFQWVYRATQPLALPLQQELASHIQEVLEQFLTATRIEPLSPEQWISHITYPDSPELTRLQSLFLVPFITDGDGEMVGLLMVGSYEAEAFNEAQVRLLYTVANQAIYSIQHLRALLASEQRGLENLVRNLPVGIVVLDETYRVLLTNPPAEHFLSMLMVDRLDQPLTHIGAFAIEDIVSEERSWEVTASASQPRILRITGSFIADVERDKQGWVLVLDDITERKQAEERIRYMALYDALTDLPNRVLFRDRLRRAMLQSQRSGRLVAVMFLDLDRFKAINDTLGHAFGDQLLQIVARRLQGCVRASDTVARLSGDEFTVILAGIGNSQDAAHVARKVQQALSQPMRLAGREIYTSASIGITLYPSDASDVDTLIKNADVAMYRAKNQGRNNYAFYTADMHLQALEWLTLERDLRKSLDQGDFVLHYQPQVNLHSGEIAGVEVLVRWQHPEMGLLDPQRFIPLAEETGLIVPLGSWVLRTACAQNRVWQNEGLPPIKIAVNMSARQIAQPTIVDEIRGILAETGLEGRYLELELAENTLFYDSDAIAEQLNGLKRLGVRLSIDDFGTGYSSVGYLKRLPIDMLKIDRSFVRDLPNDPENSAIAATIIGMTRSLHLKVIAEGVESESQRAFLLEQGCDEIQGYLYSHPIAAGELRQLLAQYGTKLTTPNMQIGQETPDTRSL